MTYTGNKDDTTLSNAVMFANYDITGGEDVRWDSDTLLTDPTTKFF